MAQKRILIVSQYPLFDKGLEAAIAQQPDLEIIGVCRDLESAYVQLQTCQPDVLLEIFGPDDVTESPMSLLQRFGGCLIRIAATGGSMEVIRRFEVEHISMKDLLNAIRIANFMEETDP